jgi:hypothetical protein
VRVALGWPSPAPVDHRDTVTMVSVGCGALIANLALAAFAARGRSPGKALLGLTLVARQDGERPGWWRGLVRSSLQAGPYAGALTVLTGVHDRFAGTQIVDADGARWLGRVREIEDPDVEVAGWKVGLAVLLHGFFAFVFMLIAAL